MRFNAFIFALTILIIGAVVLTIDAQAEKGKTQSAINTPHNYILHNQQRVFVHGINVAWFGGKYGHDIGPNAQHPSWKVRYNSKKVDACFNDIADIGFNVARVWLFEGAEGLTFDRDGYIAGVDPLFWKNLDEVIRHAHDNNVMLYLCLLTSWDDVKFPSPVVTAKAREKYITNAVLPLTKRYRKNNTIFAFDIFNEIESECAGPDGNWTKKGVTIQQTQTFIRENVRAIKSVDSKRLVSSGSGWHAWDNVQKGYYNDLGLDFIDIHVYRDDGFLPHISKLNVKVPVILGEFGQATEKRDDNIQRKADMAFMKNVVEKGYAGFLVWTYGHESIDDIHSLIGKNGQHRPAVDSLRKFISQRPKQQ